MNRLFSSFRINLNLTHQLSSLMMKNIFFGVCMSFMFAQWSSDPGSPQLLGSGILPEVKATSNGGAYIAWLTSGGFHVYIQYVDETGTAQFEAGGMLVSDHSNSSWIAVYHLNLVVDHDNNAILTLVDQRSGPWNVFAYKISPAGTMEWGEDGIQLSASNTANYSPRITVLHDNSMVTAWSENLSEVYIQRVSSEGEVLWGNGLNLSDNTETFMAPLPKTTPSGELLLQWIGQSGPVWAANSNIYLQKFDVDGNPQWNGAALITGPVIIPMGNWLQETVIQESGGSFSAWTELSGDVQSALAQHIDNNGNHLWANDVLLSGNAAHFRTSPRIAIAENTQEMLAVWNESNGSQSMRGISAQRLDENGNRLWGDNGIVVVPLTSDYVYNDLAVMGMGEELITFYIQNNFTNTVSDIFSIRLDDNGDPFWDDEVVSITNSGQPKTDLKIAGINGNFILSWSENGQIRAHCLRQDGTLGQPELNIVAGDINQDGVVTIVDIVHLVGIILGSLPNTQGSDLNDDGLTNVMDVFLLVNIVLG